jgi:hypothetical protein
MDIGNIRKGRIGILLTFSLTPEIHNGPDPHMTEPFLFLLCHVPGRGSPQEQAPAYFSAVPGPVSAQIPEIQFLSEAFNLMCQQYFPLLIESGGLPYLLYPLN